MPDLAPNRPMGSFFSNDPQPAAVPPPVNGVPPPANGVPPPANGPAPRARPPRPPRPHNAPRRVLPGPAPVLPVPNLAPVAQVAPVPPAAQEALVARSESLRALAVAALTQRGIQGLMTEIASSTFHRIATYMAEKYGCEFEHPSKLIKKSKKSSNVDTLTAVLQLFHLNLAHLYFLESYFPAAPYQPMVLPPHDVMQEAILIAGCPDDEFPELVFAYYQVPLLRAITLKWRK